MIAHRFTGWMILPLLALTLPLPARAAPDPSQRAAPPADDARYLRVDLFDVALSDGTRARGRLRVSVAIEYASPGAAAAQAPHLPMMRQRLLLATLEFAAWQATADRPLDVAQMHAMLQRALAQRGAQVRVLQAYALP